MRDRELADSKGTDAKGTDAKGTDTRARESSADPNSRKPKRASPSPSASPRSGVVERSPPATSQRQVSPPNLGQAAHVPVPPRQPVPPKQQQPTNRRPSRGASPKTPPNDMTFPIGRPSGGGCVAPSDDFAPPETKAQKELALHVGRHLDSAGALSAPDSEYRVCSWGDFMPDEVKEFNDSGRADFGALNEPDSEFPICSWDDFGLPADSKDLNARVVPECHFPDSGDDLAGAGPPPALVPLECPAPSDAGAKQRSPAVPSLPPACEKPRAMDCPSFGADGAAGFGRKPSPLPLPPTFGKEAATTLKASPSFGEDPESFMKTTLPLYDWPFAAAEIMCDMSPKPGNDQMLPPLKPPMAEKGYTSFGASPGGAPKGSSLKSPRQASQMLPPVISPRAR